MPDEYRMPNEMFREPVEEYDDTELKEALNSWLVEQHPAGCYHPGHMYDKPVKIKSSTYAFYMGIFAAELVRRDIMPVSVNTLTFPHDINFIEGRYPVDRGEDGKIVVIMGNTRYQAPNMVYI